MTDFKKPAIVDAARGTQRGTNLRIVSDADSSVIANDDQKNNQSGDADNNTESPNDAGAQSEELKPRTYLKRIGLDKGFLPRVCDEIEAELRAQDSGLFSRGGQMVRIVESKLKAADERDTIATVIRAVAPDHLRERAMRIALFIKRVGNEIKQADPGLEYFRALLERGSWSFPTLNGTISAPTLRADGSILDQPGYDIRTGLFFNPRCAIFPAIPSTPTRQDALGAISRLKAAVATFPFAADVDRSVWLSGVLTTLVRRILPSAPMHAFNAPTAGSGKSMLVDMISVIAMGEIAPVIAPGRGEEELGKQLDAALLSGVSIIAIDNVADPLESVALCQILSQQRRAIRRFHTQQTIEVDTNSAVFGTGNNLVLVGDLTRRTLGSNIDACCERPELRKFEFDPVQRAREQRGQHAVDALTIMRAYFVAGRPPQSTPLGGFEAWSRLVRDALVWLGEADPVASMDRTRASDPIIETLSRVMNAWETIFGGDRVTAARVVAAAVDELSTEKGASSQLKEALASIAGDGGQADSLRLGKWLGRMEGRILRGKRFVRDGELGGSTVWRLEKLETLA